MEAGPDWLDFTHRRLRSTLGTSEKYRINNPSRVAEVYRDAINASFIGGGRRDWLRALTLLEYYGLRLDQFVKNAGEERLLDLAALTRYVVEAMLDFDWAKLCRPESSALRLRRDSELPVEESMFRQVDNAYAPESLRMVQDMTLSVARVAIRFAVLQDVLTGSGRMEVSPPLRIQLPECNHATTGALLVVSRQMVLSILKLDYNPSLEIHPGEDLLVSPASQDRWLDDELA